MTKRTTPRRWEDKRLGEVADMAEVTQGEARALLARLDADYRPGGDDAVPPEIHDALALATRSGTEHYASLGDEDLLALLRAAAARLGHSPAQREVHPILRAYLRQRFQKWPAALKRAGLSRAAGVGGATLGQMSDDYRREEALLSEVLRAAARLGRVPHPGDLPQVLEGFRGKYATWGEVLDAAGVRREQVTYRMEKLDPETLRQLALLRAQAEALNRAPLRSEVDGDLRAALTGRCGSWRNALFQIGLEPVVHITAFATALDRPTGAPKRRHGAALQDCYYRVLRLSPEAWADLRTVAELAKTLGHPPKRGEVPAELRRHLQDACGSWSNALFQLRYLK